MKSSKELKLHLSDFPEIVKLKPENDLATLSITDKFGVSETHFSLIQSNATFERLMFDHHSGHLNRRWDYRNYCRILAIMENRTKLFPELLSTQFKDLDLISWCSGELEFIELLNPELIDMEFVTATFQSGSSKEELFDKIFRGYWKVNKLLKDTEHFTKLDSEIDRLAQQYLYTKLVAEFIENNPRKLTNAFNRPCCWNCAFGYVTSDLEFRENRCFYGYKTGCLFD